MKPISQLTTEEVAHGLNKMLVEPSSLAYMTMGLDQKIQNATISAAGMHMTMLIADGVEPEVAGRAAADMVLALAFNLGLSVGREVQATEDFTAMMGGMLSGGDSAPDAGHGE